ncbi:DUF881 domain-containing protein [Thermobrachium celere]|uniref:Division initiation protein n=1 Tax=Thermobrachium celere DSM 8682 TaxID=941824 RepID=R7RNR0_9CLOT|nr:DUF881 domain-containing protein [Thermobrachium celere]GFR35004.1 hypothetical protein TCEA9_08160 [Thermobrachium celere]CDF57832.1 Division initiation protein [Thermobrachium celere DSM 8682]
MKKIKSQLSLAFICLILGFMITYQYRLSYSKKNIIDTRQISDLVKQNELLKKQKDELEAKVKEYQSKVDEIEKAVTMGNEATEKLKIELDNLRILSGLNDVEGSGIIITLSPAQSLQSNYQNQIYATDLLDIVNELNASGAEAISINEERYTSRTQIREAGAYIKINDTKFSPQDKFIIKAIGDSNILEGAFKMPGNILEQNSDRISYKIEKSNDIKIVKFSKKIEYKYARPGR